MTVDETLKTNRWRLGSCTHDGKIERTSNGEIVVTAGKYSETGPKCTIEIVGGAERGKCLETSFGEESSSNLTRVSPCNTKDNQIFTFGTGSPTPRGSIVVTTSSDEFAADSASAGVLPHVCLGVTGEDAVTGESEESGDDDGDGGEVDEDSEEGYSGEEEVGDEDEVDGEYSSEEEEYEDGDVDEDWESEDEESANEDALAEPRRRLTEVGEETMDGPISGPILAMECTQVGVVEWVIIPYIVNNQDDDD